METPNTVGTGLHVVDGSNHHDPSQSNDRIESTAVLYPRIKGFINKWFFTSDTEFPQVFTLGAQENTMTEQMDSRFQVSNTRDDMRSRKEHKRCQSNHVDRLVLPSICSRQPVFAANICRPIKRWSLPDDTEITVVQKNVTSRKYPSNASANDLDTKYGAPYQSPKRQKTAKRYEQQTHSLTCKFCKKIFTAPQSLIRHERYSCKYTKMESFECNSCFKVFSRRDNLFRHQSSLHKL